MFTKLALLSVASLAFAPVGAPAQDGPPRAAGGNPSGVKTPATYPEAVEEIERRLGVIARLIGDEKPGRIGREADVIRNTAESVGPLAGRNASGVPREAVKEIVAAGRDLAAQRDAIVKAGDAGDLKGAKAVHAEMVRTTETLQKHVPMTYQCPMRCEGDKTYGQPRKCPKCGMTTQDVKSHRDHQGKHGGVFFMAPDQKHHLEGTLSAVNEFRIYFYDEYTKPIPADRFAAEARAWNQGADEAGRLPLKLAPAPDHAFLTGRVDASVRMPLHIKAWVDFKLGEPPQVFDFDFTAPSPPPPGGHDGH